MRKKYFTLIFAFSLLSLSLASPSFAEEIPDIDNRVTSAKSFIDSKQYFNFAPSPPGDSSLPPKCGFARFNIPGALEKEEAEVLAGEGKYLLAAEKMSEAIDFYDKCGKLKGPEKVPPRMMISKEPLDRN